MFPFLSLGFNYFIPTYLLVISLTYALCIVWVFYKAKHVDLPQALALDFCLVIMLGGFFGARLFHVFYENFEYYKMFPLDVFKVWQGGFVYYGGVMGSFLAGLAYTKIRKESFWKWADFFAPIFAVGYAAGRIGCLLNGCCYGELCDLPWAIEFKFPGLPEGARHPTQLYAIFWELFVSFSLVQYFVPKWIKKRNIKEASGLVFSIWLISHAVGRLIMESFRDDYRGEFIFNLSVSTWISLALILAGTLKCAKLWHLNKKST